MNDLEILTGKKNTLIDLNRSFVKNRVHCITPTFTIDTVINYICIHLLLLKKS
jgi:hypothetical protein